MLRQDGVFLFYVIEHRFHKQGEWTLTNLEAFDMDRQARNIFLVGAPKSAWSETGVDSTYDLGLALRALRDISEKNCKHSFRVTRVFMAQKTEPVAEYNK